MVLVQVISSSSETPELETQVSKIAMRINVTYSTITHQPLVLLRQDICHLQFIALLSVADIFMATNLREGMNLTIHDFIHCQDGHLGSHQYGSLILSEFVGSASIFRGYELLVNQWDYKKCADAIKNALEMSPTEQKRNWEFLLSRINPYNALEWHKGLQYALTKAHSIQQLRQTDHLPPLSLHDLEKAYLDATNRIFFLNDVAIFGPAFGEEEPLPSKEAFTSIYALIEDPWNMLYILSNRDAEQLREALTKLPSDLGFIIENGCFLQAPFTNSWIPFVPRSTIKWRPGIHKMMEYFHERIEGSRIEERRCSLTFHYDGALDLDVAARQASELAVQINGARGRADLHVVREATSVKVEPPHASLGNGKAASFVLNHLLHSRYPEFVFVAGSSRSDETLFRWAHELAVGPVAPRLGMNPRFERQLNVFTVTNGTHATQACSVLPVGCSLLDVLDILSGLAFRK